MHAPHFWNTCGPLIARFTAAASFLRCRTRRPEAESCFQNAVEIAQQQSAKSLELHASTSLARLWRTQGKRKEARQLLSDIYAWFTEGFGTADLQEAASLLDELSQCA